MQVKIEIDKVKTVTIPIEEWITKGRLKGYCKANKILMTQITNIEYQNQTNQNERITND